MAILGGHKMDSTPTGSPTAAPNKPATFLMVCRCFSLITALAGIICIAVNVLSAIRSFVRGSDIFDGVFRCYAVVITVVVVLAETEWKCIMKFFKILEYWVGRGMLQLFVAVMTRAFPSYGTEQKDLILLQNIASYFLLICGLIYVISGLLCVGFLKRIHQETQISREQAIKDLEVLQRRREELEQLLMSDVPRDNLCGSPSNYCDGLNP